MSNYRKIETDSPQSIQHEEVGLGLAQIFDTLWRRKSILFITCALSVSVAAVVLELVKPRYTAEALLLIGGQEENIADMKYVVGNNVNDTGLVDSQMEILKSDGLAQAVIEKLNLNQDAEFRAKSSGVGAMARSDDSNATGYDVGGGPVSPRYASPEIEMFTKRLSVSQQGKSKVVAVRFTSQDARKTALIANEIVNQYIEAQKSSNSETTREATHLLNRKIQSLRKQVEEADLAVEKYKMESGIYLGKDAQLDSKNLSEVNTQLILARAARSEMDAELSQLKIIMQKTGGIEAAADVLSSELIQSLKTQRAEVQRKIAELSTEFGPKHPLMVNLKAKAKSFDTKIEEEVKRRILSMQNKIAIARSRENSLQQSLNNSKNRVAVSNNSLVTLRALEREADAYRSLLESFLSRVKETSFQQEIQRADSKVVQWAMVPERPSFPKKTSTLVLVFTGAGIVGLLLIFYSEHIFQGFRSGEQVEQAMAADFLGIVPMIHGSQASKLESGLDEYLEKNKHTAFMESINTLRWSLHLNSRNANQRPRKIMITSTLPREGKSTIALFLSAIQAIGEQKVVLIDADCRMARINKTLGMARGPGLTELIKKEKTIKEVTVRWDKTGVDVIPAGWAEANPTNMIASDAMDELLEKLTEEYDVIICDTPPITAASDALILSKKMDANIFVVRWDKTRRSLAVRAVRQLIQAGGPVSGILLTMVDVRKHSAYGYSDSGYYGKGVAGYYAK